ncbi:two-component sensor histidine kinase [Rathayibacter sp. AY1A3]|nr:two-component sensor histidine kinase [Rathayibacter sp. AY1A3]
MAYGATVSEPPNKRRRTDRTAAPPRRVKTTTLAARYGVDVLLVAVGVLSQLPFLFWATPWIVASGLTAAAAIPLRHRYPLALILLSLPGFIWGEAFVPVAIGLTVLTIRDGRSWRVGGAVALVSAAWFIPEQIWEYPEFVINTVLWALIYIGVPVLIGTLIRTKKDLAQRVDELTRLHQKERTHVIESALARERTLLAREMHDVVSHHVTLIAIQAGALQVSSPDHTARATATTIRSLASATVEELRTMVGVLRDAGGQPRERVKEPSSNELAELAASSDLTIHGSLTPPPLLSPAAHRAVYRFLQEGLTNARKHSTGAEVTLMSNTTADHFTVSLHAGPPTRPPLALPSARHGLLGLQERAALLGGTLTAELDEDGSHLLTMNLPNPASS